MALACVREHEIWGIQLQMHVCHDCEFVKLLQTFRGPQAFALCSVLWLLESQWECGYRLEQDAVLSFPVFESKEGMWNTGCENLCSIHLELKVQIRKPSSSHSALWALLPKQILSVGFTYQPRNVWIPLRCKLASPPYKLRCWLWNNVECVGLVTQVILYVYTHTQHVYTHNFSKFHAEWSYIINAN